MRIAIRIGSLQALGTAAPPTESAGLAERTRRLGVLSSCLHALVHGMGPFSSQIVPMVLLPLMTSYRLILAGGNATPGTARHGTAGGTARFGSMAHAA